MFVTRQLSQPCMNFFAPIRTLMRDSAFFMFSNNPSAIWSSSTSTSGHCSSMSVLKVAVSPM